MSGTAGTPVIPASNASAHSHARRESIRIPVTGMTCAACQARVQSALARQPGVEDASVNLMMESAAVTFDPAITSPHVLVSAVRDTGYGAELPTADVSPLAEQEARDRSQREELRAMSRKAIVSIVAGALAMLLPMVLPMLPLPPAVQTRVLPLVLLALSATIMAWAGRHFYVHAWQALQASLGRHGHAHRGRHRRRISVFARRDVRAGILPRARRRAESVLRGGDRDHRARAHGQRLRGARQTEHVGRAASARRAAARNGARRAGRAGGRRSRRRR